MNKAYLFFVCSIMLSACERKPERLPILGERTIESRTVQGKITEDSVYHSIPPFKFTDQRGEVITEKTFAKKIYIADFFFTSCPTICPVMKSQMLRVYEKYASDNRLLFLSHTIDPEHDTVQVLKEYAERLGVEGSRWHFVTGSKDSIYKIAREYMVSAQEDKNAPGGFIHSGALVLLDQERRVRGYYDGTDAKRVDQLITDIAILLNEK